MEAYHDPPATRSGNDGGKHPLAAAKARQTAIPRGSACGSPAAQSLDSARRAGQPVDAPGIAQARKALSSGRFLV